MVFTNTIDYINYVFETVSSEVTIVADIMCELQIGLFMNLTW
jgi:hypothetical protein